MTNEDRQLVEYTCTNIGIFVRTELWKILDEATEGNSKRRRLILERAYKELAKAVRS